MLVVVHFWGAANKGATRWIYMGSFSIQPSEIAKLVLIMLSARFLGNAMKLGEKISLYKGECLLVTMAAGIAAFGVLVPVSYTHLDVYKRQSLLFLRNSAL